MKIFTSLLFVVLAMSLIGCSKEKEFTAFTSELDAVTKEVAAKIDSNPTAAGITEAQSLFDSKKAGLKSKWEVIKGLRDYQVSFDSKRKLQASVKDGKDVMNAACDKAIANAGGDMDVRNKADALMTAYEEFFTK